MGQTKIENQIKEKLNAREIQPSAQAWDRLDAMLTIAEQKKTKRIPFWGIGIAASVLVLLTAGWFLFNQEKTVSIPANAIVVTPEIETPNNNKHQTIIEDNQVVTTDTNQSKIGNQKSVHKNKAVSIINHKNQRAGQQAVQNPIINRQKEVEFLINGDVAAVKSMPKFISTDPVKVQQKNQEVAKKPSYVDVNDLLAAAESELKAKPKSHKIKVDATTLLSHAEGEVEQTFRQKVLNSVSENYKEVKVALGNRNKE